MFMNTLKPQQKRVLNTIKVFQAEYLEGVPYNILKLDLDIPEEDLTAILGFLEEKEYISRKDGIIIFEKDTESEKGEDISEQSSSNENQKETVENNIPNSSVVEKTPGNGVDNSGEKSDSEDSGEIEVEDQLSEIELRSLEIIKEFVDDSGNISRTLLEGTILYGELEFTSIRMYNLITSLEYKGILKKITLKDGEYYKFTP